MKLRLPRSVANMRPKWAQASSSNIKLGCGEVAKICLCRHIIGWLDN